MKPRFLLAMLLLMHLAISAQMKIGNNPTSINNASLLELETTNKGFVFPRVTLTNVALASPLPTGLLTGTVVFNTNTSIVNGNGIGLYVWNGTAWNSIYSGSVSSVSWSLTGNAGTAYATNFLGTTDNVSLRFKTNNIQRMIIDSIGTVGIGSESFNTENREKLLVDYGTTKSNTVATFKGRINSYLQMNIQNTSPGSNASADYVATADDGTDSTFYVDMGINNSNYSPNIENWGRKHDAYLYCAARSLLIGAQDAASDIIFMIGGGVIDSNTVMRINGPSGGVIIGKGDQTTKPVGNTIRAPAGSGTNIAGGNLNIRGGTSTGTAKGGSINLFGGTSLSGESGTINITALPLNIYGVQATTTITADSILTIYNGTVKKIAYSALPSNAADWSILGNTGTAPATNFLGTTDAQPVVFRTTNIERVRLDATGNLGVGTSNPLNKLSVIATNPLYLGGVQATTTFSSDSVLTINAGIVKKTPYNSLPVPANAWLLNGNGGTTSSNFLGTTDAQPLIIKSLNRQLAYFDGNLYSVAIGFGAVNNSSDRNVAIGYNASTNNQYTMALGVSASATGAQSTALGYAATAGNQYALALGYQATASGVRSIALGNGSTPTASGAESIAIGYGATASGVQSTAIGYTAQASGSYNIGVGYDAQTTGSADAIAIGRATRASQQYAAAIGYNAQATGTQSTAIGYNAQTSQSNTILLGSASTANLYVGIGTATPAAKLHIVGGTTTNYPLQMTGLPTGTAGTDNILTINSTGVVGYVTPSTFNGTYWNLNGNAASSGNFLGTTNSTPLLFKFNSTNAGYLDANNTSFGTSSAAASGTNNTAIGYSVTASNGATAVGANAVANAANNLAVGNSALANSGSQATAVGASSQAQFQNNVAIGYNAQATTSSQETVIGASAQAQGQNNIAIGYTARANGSDKITAVGATAQGSFQNNTVVGYGALATTNSQSTAIGASALAQAQNATALGYNAKAQANNATAIGANASTSQANALILGDATTTVNVGIGTATPNTNTKLDVDGSFKLGDAGTVTKNIVSFSSTLGSTNIPAGTGGPIILFGTVTFAASSTDVTVTIPSSANYLSSTQATISVSPAFDLPTSVSIASARMISTSQVRVRFVNASTNAQTISGNLYVSIKEF